MNRLRNVLLRNAAPGKRSQVVKDDEVDIRCFRGHRLVYQPKLYLRAGEGWGCDAGDFGNLTAELQTYRRDYMKGDYGIPQEEEWNCLSGFDLEEYPDGWTHTNVPTYNCTRCNFLLCDRCYERAYYDRLYTQQIAKAIEESAAVRWNQGKVKWFILKLV